MRCIAIERLGVKQMRSSENMRAAAAQAVVYMNQEGLTSNGRSGDKNHRKNQMSRALFFFVRQSLFTRVLHNVTCTVS